MGFAVGGPVIPNHHHLFFYFAAELLRSSQSTNGSVTFADPQFTAFAQTNFPNTVGTHLLSTYLPANVSGVGVSQTAQDIFGTGASGCGTAATSNIPCALPMIDAGSFSATQIRNGTQYFARLDAPFKNDRVYASLFRTLLTSGAASAMPQFSALNPTWQVAGQLNWTHTFSPTTLNDASAGISRVEGLLGSGAKDYTVPSVSVNGINVDSGQAFGVGFAQGDFIQHNYHWRDVLTHVRGAHTLKFGYEGWYGDDVEPFQGPWSQPKFAFDNLLKLAQDAPTNENGIMYDPATGQQKLWNWDAASRTFGLFVQDTWKVRRNLTLTMGLRYDDSGNPWSKSDTTVFGNFYLGTGTTSAGANCQRLRQAYPQRPAALGEQPVQPACRRCLGSHREWRLGGARRFWYLQQLADPGQRPGRIPRQSSGTGLTDLLRGRNGDRGRSDFCSGKQQQATVWIYIPDLPGRP